MPCRNRAKSPRCDERKRIEQTFSRTEFEFPGEGFPVLNGSTTSASSIQQVEEVRRLIEENTPIGTVEFGGFSENQVTVVTRELLVAHSRGYLDNLQRMTTDREYGNPRVHGLYDPNDRAIFINPEYFTRKHIQQAYERGWFARETLAYLVHHELGHHLHYETIRAYENPFERAKHLDSVAFSSEMEERIKREVSQYAVERPPYEFIAEVFAVKWAGQSVSAKLEVFYETYDGPKP